MADPRLHVRDALGEREVVLDHFPFTIGRRDTNDLRLGGSEVSREHAEIDGGRDGLVVRDRESRYGTFVNGDPVTECPLKPGDQIRLGRGGGADLTLMGDGDRVRERTTIDARED